MFIPFLRLHSLSFYFQFRNMSRLCAKIDESVVSSGFFDSFDNVFTDCDGVLWIENDAIPGSPETLQRLSEMGKSIMYVTNNSTKSREEYLKKLKRLGFPATLDSIFPTSYLVGSYLKSQNFNKKAYIMGATGIAKELDVAGIKYLPLGPDPVADDWMKWISELELEPDVGAVIVAFDHYISHPKLTKAASYLKDPKCIFIAPNRDEQFPSRNGELIVPGSGTFVAAVEVASGRKAITLGKPERFVIDSIKEKYPHVNLERTIMIGDRLNTDIVLGTAHGIKTLLVLTGINSLEDVEKCKCSQDEKDKLQVPDYYLPCLGDLRKFMKTQNN